MKPPEKREPMTSCPERQEGYNQAIDDMHKWIGEAPIAKEIADFCNKTSLLYDGCNILESKIRKLLKGE